MYTKSNKKSFIGICVALLFGFAATGVYATNYQSEPVELLIDYDISGQFTGVTEQGLPIYTIGGPGFAPWYIFRSGEIIDINLPWRQVAVMEGAEIVFSGQFDDPVINFTCLPGSCTMTFNDGSVLKSDAGVPLTGRAINKWGPVINSPDFDPVAGVAPIRILGCGGLKEVAGKGRLAGMVGSICFNGVLNFDQNNPLALTGSSKCTITMHTPADPDAIP